MMKGRIIYRFLYALRHNDVNSMTRQPLLLASFPDFDKIDIYLKDVSNVFSIKKAGYIFEKPYNLHLAVFTVGCFPLLIWIEA